MSTMTETIFETLLKEMEEQQKLHHLPIVEKKAKQLLKLAEKEQNHYYESIAWYFISLLSFYNEDKQKAMKACGQGLKLCESADNVRYEIRLMNLAGILYADSSNELTALHHFINAYFLSKEHPEYGFMQLILKNMGTLFFSIGMYQEALQYYTEAFDYMLLDKFEKGDLQIVISHIMFTLARMNEQEEVRIWKKKYDELDNELAKIPEEYVLSELYLDVCAHTTSKVPEKMEQVLKNLYQEEDYSHIKNCMFFMLEMSLHMKNDSLFIKLYQTAKKLFKDMKNPYFEEELSQIYIQYLKEFHKDNLKDEIYQHYEIYQKAQSFNLENRKISMKVKMDLENTLYKQRKIIENNQKLMQYTQLDDFTGVLKKTAFRKQTIEKLQRRNKNQKAFFLTMDIDNFKHINDSYGHMIGDRVIKEIVAIIKNNVDQNTLIGRVGGDEFAIYADHVYELYKIENCVEKIKNDVQDIKIRNVKKRISISIGICEASDDDSYDIIYKKADHALYEAKLSGRNQYVVYEEDNVQEESLLPMHSNEFSKLSISAVLPKVFMILNTEKKSNTILDRAICYIGRTLHIEDLFLLYFIDRKKEQGYLKVFNLNDKSIRSQAIYHIEEGYFNEFDETGLFQNHDLNHCDFPYETKYKENHIMSTIQKKIEYDGHFYGIVGMNKKSRQVWNIKDVLLIENMACAFSTYFESWRKQD